MAISVIGTPISAAATTVTPPTHAVGDYIVIVALRSATTAPTLPAGYTQIVTGTGNSNSYRVGYKVATSTTDASGTWTNASLLLCMVYRGASGIGASSAATHAAATTTAIPTITVANQNSKSWVVAFAGHAATSTQGTPLAGATTSRVAQTAGTYNGGMFDTNAGVNSFSATTSANTTSVVNCGGTFELIAADPISGFSDTMSGSTQNTTLWGGNFGTLSWSPSGFTITNPISYTGYGGETSKLYYDLTGSSFTANMPTGGNQSLTSCETVPFALQMNATNYVEFYINAGFLFAQKNVNGSSSGVGSSIAYNPTTMSWFKLSESGGTLTWAYGNDGVTWTTLASAANPIPITAVQIQPTLGTFSAEASSTTAVWNSFNPSFGVSTSVAQVAANITAAGGTQSVATVNDVAVSQVAANVTATGGAQTVSATAIISISVTQVATAITATGGTQSFATINDVSISQTGATLTTAGGIQSPAAVNIVSISQLAVNITATGGSQGIQDIQDVQIAQSAANVTATSGTQSVSTANYSTVAQTGGTLTARGGTQVVSTVQNVSISQIVAVLTVTGGVQSVATGSLVSISITQVAATLISTGGTQTIATIQDASVTQSAANLTIDGGMQSFTTSNYVALSQAAASLAITGGIQSISAIGNTTVSQVGATLTVIGGTPSLSAQIAAAIAQQVANLIVNGGTQSISSSSGAVSASVSQVGSSLTLTGGIQIVSINSSPLPPHRTPNPIFLLDGRIAVRLASNLYLPL